MTSIACKIIYTSVDYSLWIMYSVNTMQIKIHIKQSISGYVAANFANKIAKLQLDKINGCAVTAQESMETTIERKIDSPTPFTKRAIYRTRATSGKPYAAVGIKAIQAAYLTPLIKGGIVRKTKPVPTPYTANQFGNLPLNASKQWTRKKGIAAYKSKRGNIVYAQYVGNDLYMLATWSKVRNYKMRIGSIITDAVKHTARSLR